MTVNRMRLERLAPVVLFFCNGMLFATSAAAIPRIAERLHLGSLEVAGMTAAMSFGSICVMPRAGALIAKFGSRDIAWAAAFTATACMPIVVEAPSYFLLTGFGVCFGAAMGVMDVAMNAYAIGIQRLHRTSLLSQVHGCWSIGSVVASAAMAALIVLHSRLPGLMLALAIAALVAIATQSARRLAPEQGAASGRTISRPLILLGALALLGLLVEGAMSDWGALFVQGRFRVPVATAVLAYTTFVAAMTLGRFTGDAAVLRFGSGRMFAFGSVFTAGGMWLAIAAPDLRTTLAAFACVGFGCANLVPIVFAAAERTAGAKGIALVSAIGYVAFFTGPALIGGTAHFIGLAQALVIVASSASIAAIAALTRPVRNLVADSPARGGATFGAD